jgi:mitotic spindle assembly checkpoint protein MAD2B
MSGRERGSNIVVDLLLEFLEAFVHQVLCLRHLYSPELFERKRIYGVAVRRSRHPDLNDYIHEVVSSLKVS